MDQPIIEVDQLSKRYGEHTAVDAISFSVHAGELFGFLGPNGAGKSTTIGMLATLVRPSGGRATVNGFDVLRDPAAVRSSIGLIFQDPSLDTQLTAWENLWFHARVYHLPRAEIAGRIEHMLKLVDLWPRHKDLVKTFSGGMKRRLEIARGLLHAPQVLFLDEPTLGLDPQTREHIWTHLRDLRAQTGLTLFLTTHHLEEADQCDRIAIIDHGRIVALDTPERLKANVGGDVIILRTRDNERARMLIRQEFGLDSTEVDGEVHLQVDHGETFIPRLIQALPVQVEAINLRRPTLDDVFLSLTGRAIRSETSDASEVMRLAMRARGR